MANGKKQRYWSSQIKAAVSVNRCLAEKAKACYLRSNRESGLGRYDVMMEPKDSSGPAVIMEFKSPEDELSIDVFYKVQAYAGLYKASGETVKPVVTDGC